MMTDARSQSTHDPFSVLYVDDEEGLLNLGKLFLERTGDFIVDTAISAESALSSFHIPSFDAIISDYQMTGMDGIDLLKTVRKEYGDIPFILFTGRGREEVVIEAINNGADFYLQKGGDPKSQFAELSHKILQAIRRNQAESRLRESEKRLSEIIDFLPDATFAIDRKGTIIAWNRAIEEMTGYAATDMLGKGEYEYAIPLYGHRRPILIDLINEPDENIRPLYRNIIRSGHALMAETDYITPKGEQVSLFGKVCPLYNQEGEIAGAIESIRDISQVKRMTTELHESEVKFKTLVEYSRDCILIVGFDGTVHFINSTGLTMVDEELADLIVDRKNVMEYVHPDSHELVLADMNHVAQGNEAYFSQYKLITGKGREIWVESQGRKIPYQKSHAIFVTLRDITSRKKEEETLRESEEQYRALTEQSPDIIVRVDPNFQILYCNSRFTEYSGIPVRDVIGKDARNIVSYDNSFDSWAEAVERAFETGIPSREQYFIYSEKWFDCLIYPEFREDHTVRAVSTSVRDITSIKNTEEEREIFYEKLVTQREFIGSLLEAIPVPVQWKDMNRRYLGCNKAFIRFAGLPREEIIGKRVEDVWPEPGDLNELDFQDIETVSSGFLSSHRTKLTDLSGKTHDVIISKSLFHDKYGKPVGIVGVLQDITEYNGLIRDLKKQEELFRMIITQSSDIFVILSPQLEVTYISPSHSKLSGFLTDEILGPAERFIHPDDFPRIKEHIERLMINPAGIETADFRSRKRDGTYILLEGTALNCIDNPVIQGILITAQDITERRRNEKLVEERTQEVAGLLELKDSLLTAIAHELRTPLTPLTVLLPLLGEEEDPSKRNELMGIIRKNISRISSIVGDLLQLANLGTMYKIEEVSEVYISQLMDNLINVYALAADKKGVTIKSEIKPETCITTSSPHLISILDNLISNAVKYSKQDGNIIIKIREMEDFVEIMIRDDGIGISSSDLPRIFEPFFKGDLSRHDRSSPGLGLSITRRLVQVIGGNISIYSEGVDKGTEAIIRLKRSFET